MATIKSIYGDEPHRNGEYPVAYVVDHGGVTSITELTQNLGDYGIVWFHVWDNSGAEIAKVNARYVAVVEYEKAGA